VETPDLSGFARAMEPRPFTFPADHGPHLDYQTEWWYYTGNFETAEGRHFGYQLTFFRRALAPGTPDRASAFATTQIYFAHFALTEVSSGTHTFFERFSRGAAGLAGASGDPFTVWLEDWRTEALDEQGEEVRLQAAEGPISIDLTLQSVKPIVAQGDRGLSPKSEEPGNASYYLSFTRLHTIGQITVGNQSYAVSGESWFDHEWSTSALGPQAVGWDWFSLQLNDDREVMFYQIRLADGSVEPVSAGTLIEADGPARGLTQADVVLTVTRRWKSLESDADYPAGWRLQVPSAGIDLAIEPWVADQEMRVSFDYWEGAVRVHGTSAGRPVDGNGYVELTGYGESMQGVL
jgi:predicted secreted hydrolase